MGSTKPKTDRVFTGAFQLNVGTDYRFTMPLPWMEAFGKSGVVWMTCREPGRWRLYSSPTYVAFFDDFIERQHVDHAGTRPDFAMHTVAVWAYLDKRRRFKIPPEMRPWLQAQAPFPARLIGCGSYAELWPEGAWEAEQDRGIFGDSAAAERLRDLAEPILREVAQNKAMRAEYGGMTVMEQLGIDKLLWP